MSQFFISSSGGSVPPEVATSYPTDIGIAIPSGNVLNVLGGYTESDTDPGVETIANPDGSNNLYILLTNRMVGSATSTNASTENLITFSLAGTAKVYRFNFLISARDTGSGDGAGYSLEGTARTNGTTATIISVPNQDDDEDASLITASVNLVASGNSVILQVTGVTGRTIAYKSVGTYVVV